MLQETRHFFQQLVLTDRSALNMLDSTFTMLNEPLARHYGVSGVTGQAYREVTLEEEDRGGLLGHAPPTVKENMGISPIRETLFHGPSSPILFSTLSPT